MRLADLPEATERIHIDAPAERIWALISDITVPMSTSEELRAVVWCDDAGGAAPSIGRRFVGTNVNEYFGEWQTTSTVIECDEPHTFAWAVGNTEGPNTTWRFTVDPDGTLSQWVRIGPGESGLVIAVERMPDKEERIVAGRVAQFRAAMRANLETIKQRAEGR